MINGPSLWVPDKSLVGEVQGFKIFKSEPKKSPQKDVNGMVQVAVVHPKLGDMFRAESYTAGYFGSAWNSHIGLVGFLAESERYFQEFEHKFSEKPHGRLTIPDTDGDLLLYEFERPLTTRDFTEAGLSIDAMKDRFLRIDTDAAAICYDPKNQEVGMIKYLDQGDDKPTIDAVARFVHRTQSLLPVEAVVKALALLPYRR